MALRIAPYTEADVAAVLAFNSRLTAGGADPAFRMEESSRALWIPPDGAGSLPYQEFFLAWDDDVVRGGYALKRQRFWLAGEELTVDYGLSHHDGQLACRCGAPGCCGWI